MSAEQTAALFDLSGRVAVITGGAGLLGEQHARAIAGAGGVPVLVDIAGRAASDTAARIQADYGVRAWSAAVDITDAGALVALRDQIFDRYGRLDILVNNAAVNPKAEARTDESFSRLERFPIEQWNAELAVGLTGSFLCTQVLGAAMASRGRGVIVNVASDLALIAPDQRLYRRADVSAEEQPVKPVTYSVVKAGLIGLTRYVATYWADRGIRANALCPGGVYNGQSDEFVVRLSNLVPLARMAEVNEYRGAIIFLCSDASSYMTGAIVAIDGGRTCW